jgi:hypothetical protein
LNAGKEKKQKKTVRATAPPILDVQLLRQWLLPSSGFDGLVVCGVLPPLFCTVPLSLIG